MKRQLFKLILASSTFLLIGCGSDSGNGDGGASGLSAKPVVACDGKDLTSGVMQDLCIEYTESSGLLDFSRYDDSCLSLGATPTRTPCPTSELIGSCSIPTGGTLSMTYKYYAGRYTLGQVMTLCGNTGGTFIP